MLSKIGVVFISLFIAEMLFAAFAYDTIYSWTKKKISIYLTVTTWCAVIGYLGIILGYYFNLQSRRNVCSFYFGKISDGNKLWERAVLIFWEKFEK